MRICVLGSSGQIGKALCHHLTLAGHEVVPATRATGADIITGEGVDDLLRGCDVAVNCTNAYKSGKEAIEFFEVGTRTFVEQAYRTKIKHIVQLSIVGVANTALGEVEPGYLTGHVRMEEIVASSGLPYTIARGAQLFDFLDYIGLKGQESQSEDGGRSNTTYVPGKDFQPISTDDLGKGLAEVTTQEPVNGIVDIVGPEVMKMSEAVKKYYAKVYPGKLVEANKDGLMLGYFRVKDKELMPDQEKRITGQTTLDQWLESKSSA